jgi:hypothetical protein
MGRGSNKEPFGHSKLVLLAWCAKCRYDQRVIIDFYEYPTKILSGENPKIACKNCRKLNTLAYLDLLLSQKS